MLKTACCLVGLADICKRIAQKEATGENGGDDTDSDPAPARAPFSASRLKLREFHANIVMNIKVSDKRPAVTDLLYCKSPHFSPFVPVGVLAMIVSIYQLGFFTSVVNLIFFMFDNLNK